MNKQAVLFDLDGTLVLSEELRGLAHAQTVAYYGGQVSPNIYEDVMGCGHEVVRAKFIKAGRLKIDNLDEYTRISREIYLRLIETFIRPAPHAAELLRELRSHELCIGVVSGSPRSTLIHVLKLTSLFDYFDLIVSADDVINKKPAPDSYLLALEKIHTSPEFVLAVEDTEAGIQSAVGAGLDVLAIRHSLNRTHDFSIANKIIQELTEVGIWLQEEK